MKSTTTKIKYGDVCTVNSGFYKGCQVRVIRRRIFGLFYRVQIIYPYFGNDALISGFRLKLKREANKD